MARVPKPGRGPFAPGPEGAETCSVPWIGMAVNDALLAHGLPAPALEVDPHRKPRSGLPVYVTCYRSPFPELSLRDIYQAAHARTRTWVREQLGPGVHDFRSEALVRQRLKAEFEWLFGKTQEEVEAEIALAALAEEP